MTKKIVILLILVTTLFNSCDPSMSGDSKIFNESNTVLTIRYTEYNDGKVDTLSKDIQPGEIWTMDTFGGLGDKSKLDCCPYHMIVSIKSSSGPIKKQSTCETWEIPNKTKLKKFSGESIKCEFHITQADI